MGYDSGYHYPNHSELHRAIMAHYRARGVTSERKLWDLVLRWKAMKGCRPPFLNKADEVFDAPAG